MTVKKEKGFKFCECRKCGHVWVPRKLELPLICPNKHCHSPRWNKELKKEEL